MLYDYFSLDFMIYLCQQCSLLSFNFDFHKIIFSLQSSCFFLCLNQGFIWGIHFDTHRKVFLGGLVGRRGLSKRRHPREERISAIKLEENIISCLAMLQTNRQTLSPIHQSCCIPVFFDLKLLKLGIFL